MIVAALGPLMLKVAGRLADGTATWMTGLKTLESHTVPTIREAAKEAGRPEPRVIVALPVAITQDAAAAREVASKLFAMYGTLPSYRAMLDREGVEGPAGVGMVGDEAELRKQIGRLRDIGVTDFDAAIASVEEGTYERTLDFLASLT